MKRLAAILLGVLGFAGNALAQTAPDAATHPAPSAATVEEFQDLVQIGDHAQVAQQLARDPRLAQARGPFGFSAMNLQDLNFDPRIHALLLENGADVNAANDEGITLLHILAAPEYVPLLVQSGADLEARDALGQTPLLAQLTEPDRADMVAALLAAGADPNVQGARGQTPLSLAAEAEDGAELMRLLRDYGARQE